MTGWHGILSLHVLTVLLSLAGWLQNGCHSEKRTSGDCSSEMLSILKIEMIEQSDGTKSIFSSFLLSSTDSNPYESTTFNTVWPPQLQCWSPAYLASHQQWLQQGIRGQSGNCLWTVRPSVSLTFLLGFRENQVTRVTHIIHKDRQCFIFCGILFDPWFNLRHVLHVRCQAGKLGPQRRFLSDLFKDETVFHGGFGRCWNDLMDEVFCFLKSWNIKTG